MSEHDYSQKQSESCPVIRLLPPSISRTMEKPEAAQTIQQCAVDGVSQYASAVLNDGLLLLEFKDAIREGDGPRILRCYKALLLYYRFAKHYNYCKEAFRTLATVNALATPRVAQQITWSRVVNVNGRPGHNIPVDLENEHLNRSLKDAITGVGANVTQKSIIQCGKSLNSVMKVLSSFDKENNLHREAANHSAPSTEKDKLKIVKELCDLKVFDYIPGRQHHTFKGIKSNAALKVDLDKYISWLLEQKNELQREQNVAKLYEHKI